MENFVIEKKFYFSRKVETQNRQTQQIPKVLLPTDWK
jgi:hypothetical protein